MGKREILEDFVGHDTGLRFYFKKLYKQVEWLDLHF